MLRALDLDATVRDALSLVESDLEIGLFALDVATGEMRWSYGMYRLLGLSEAETKPSLASFRTALGNDELVNNELDLSISARHLIDFVVKPVLKDKRAPHLRIRAQFLFQEAVNSNTLSGYVQDVTRLSQEREISEIHASRFKTLVGMIDDICWLSSSTGAIKRLLNSHAGGRAHADMDLDECLTRHIHPDDLLAAITLQREALVAVRPYAAEVRTIAEDGAWSKSWLRGTPVTSSGGRVVEWIGTLSQVHNPVRYLEPDDPLTGAQIRAGRGIANLSVRELSAVSGVSAAAIRRAERGDGPTALPAPPTRQIRTALEVAGVSFIVTPDGLHAAAKRQQILVGPTTQPRTKENF